MGCTQSEEQNIRDQSTQYDLIVGSYILKRVSKISRGAYSIIWKCQDIKTGTLYALKQMRLNDNLTIEAYEKQVRLMSLAKKAHLHGEVQILATVDEKDSKMGRVGRILEQLGTQTLFDQVNSQQFTQHQIVYIIKEIAEDLMELHSIGVYHFDVKPENVLLVGKKYKLCDFGSSRTHKFVYDQLSEHEQMKLTDFIEEHTTMHYRPPEMIEPKGQEIGPAADMWMLGCCLYIVAFGEHPFADKNPDKITNCQISYPNEGYFTDLCRKLLIKDAKKRLTARQVDDILTAKLNDSS